MPRATADADRLKDFVAELEKVSARFREIQEVLTALKQSPGSAQASDFHLQQGVNLMTSMSDNSRGAAAELKAALAAWKA
jgi:hypothetical protein